MGTTPGTVNQAQNLTRWMRSIIKCREIYLRHAALTNQLNMFTSLELSADGTT